MLVAVGVLLVEAHEDVAGAVHEAVEGAAHREAEERARRPVRRRGDAKPPASRATSVIGVQAAGGARVVELQDAAIRVRDGGVGEQGQHCRADVRVSYVAAWHGRSRPLLLKLASPRLIPLNTALL